MTSDETLARNRWLALVAARLAGTAGAVFGLILLARAPEWPGKLLGLAIVPLHLARLWRSPK